MRTPKPVEAYKMPDGSTTFLNLLPDKVMHPETGQVWYAIHDPKGEREIRRLGTRIPCDGR